MISFHQHDFMLLCSESITVVIFKDILLLEEGENVMFIDRYFSTHMIFADLTDGNRHKALHLSIR